MAKATHHLNRWWQKQIDYDFSRFHCCDRFDYNFICLNSFAIVVSPPPHFDSVLGVQPCESIYIVVSFVFVHAINLFYSQFFVLGDRSNPYFSSNYHKLYVFELITIVFGVADSQRDILQLSLSSSKRNAPIAKDKRCVRRQSAKALTQINFQHWKIPTTLLVWFAFFVHRSEEKKISHFCKHFIVPFPFLSFSFCSHILLKLWKLLKCRFFPSTLSLLWFSF